MQKLQGCLIDYFVSFNGHLVESTRPEGWPKVVRDKFVYRAKEVSTLLDFLNKKAKEYQNSEGMTVETEEGMGSDNPDLISDKDFGKGVYVPMHMIAYISYTIRRMSAEMPDTEDPGVVIQ
jgi:hypothetical protein